MRQTYAKEKFSSAVAVLKKGSKDLKSSIWDAYLIFHPLSENDFSDELKDDWNFIHRELTTENPSYNEAGEVTEGKVQNTLKKMSEGKCTEIVKRIIDLEKRLSLS